MRGLIEMFEHKKLIFYFTIYLIVFHVIDLKTLTNKKKSIKGKVRSDNEKTTTVSTEKPQDDDQENTAETDSPSKGQEETATESPTEESSSEETDDSSSSDSEDKSDDTESESEEDEKIRGKITKDQDQEGVTEAPNDEPNVTHVYGENEEGEEVATTLQPTPTTTRKPSKMVPTGSWTLACPNPCSQSCAPSCTPQCCEGHFSMTAPVPVSDEPPLAPNIPPMNTPPMNPPLGGGGGGVGGNAGPPQCPDSCNNNPSCNSVCDPSCCTLQSLKTFLDTAAGIMNSPICAPQCTGPNCNSNPTCPASCCSPSNQNSIMSAMGGQSMPPQPPPPNVNCPPECFTYGQDCNRMCRSECCPTPSEETGVETTEAPSVDDNSQFAKSAEMEQAIAKGRVKCPDYCNSTECLSKCPIICC